MLRSPVSAPVRLAPPSPFLWGLSRRLLVAAGAVLVLWLAVAWALRA